MKSIAILIAPLLITTTVYASTSEQFFTAYQVAQVSGLSKVIATQAHNPQIIADTITKLQQQKTDTVADKAASEKTKDGYKKEVDNYLNSPQANDYFDKLATDVLAKSYSYEQLKALYQLYTTSTVQNYLPNEITFANQQNTQRYLITSKFNQQLDEKTKQILDSVKLEEKPESLPIADSQAITKSKETDSKKIEPKTKLKTAIDKKIVLETSTKLPVKVTASVTTEPVNPPTNKPSDTAQKEVAIKKE